MRSSSLEFVKKIPLPSTQKQIEPSKQVEFRIDSYIDEDIETDMPEDEALTRKIKLYFNDREEVLKIIDSGGDIIQHLSKENDICPLIGSYITIGKMIGKGKNAAVFDIKIPGFSKTSYVAKITDPFTYVFFTQGREDWDILEGNLKAENSSMDLVLSYNGLPINYDRDIPIKIHVPRFMVGGSCSKKDGTSYICDATFSEYLISILVANLRRNGISVHFLDTFLFATCFGSRKIEHYIFMEKIDTNFGTLGDQICEKKFSNLNSINPNPNPEAVNSLYIQVLHALACIQDKYQIVHGDLHEDNVFIEYITKETQYNGKYLSESEYFEYIIDGVSVYIPNIGMLVKLGDWGFACKYSEPMICNKDVLDGKFPGICNYYTAAYDTLFITNAFYFSNPSNEFLASIYGIMLNGVNIRKQLKKYFIKDPFRPNPEKIRELRNLANPFNILTNNTLMGKYLKKPPKGSKIITLGDI